jgi:hypothetical protein
MMRIQSSAFTLSATALFAGFATAAPAQENPYAGGTRLTNHPAEVERTPGALTAQDNARITLSQFARCVLKTQHSPALRAIKIAPWSPDERKALHGISDDRCLANGELSIPLELMRGAVFQELYRQTYAAGPPALPADPVDFTDGEKPPLAGEAAIDVAMRRFGDCVARRDLADSHALVLASPGTQQETDAISRLLPHFRACVVRGGQWKITKSVVSTLMAEVLYREGAASQAAGDSGH